MMATGVASPKAQGQEITSTATALGMENSMPFPIKSQINNVSTETVMTKGTNTEATLSAILAIGAFVAAASDTIFMIWDNVVSFPTLAALAFT